MGFGESEGGVEEGMNTFGQPNEIDLNTEIPYSSIEATEMASRKIKVKEKGELVLCQSRLPLTSDKAIRPPNLSDIELSYMAGLFDGEGSIGVCKSKNKRLKRGYRFILQVQLTMVEKDMVYHFKNRFGGHVRESKYKNRRRIYHWVITCRKARIFLDTIYPHLKIKKPQAKIGIDYQNKIKYQPRLSDSEYKYKEECREKIMDLNAKGLCSKYIDNNIRNGLKIEWSEGELE